MSSSPFKSAQDCSKRALAQLGAQLRLQQELRSIIKDALPHALAERVDACVLSGRKLLLYTPSAAWATQLRFHGGAVLLAVNALAGISADVMVVRVMPPEGMPLAPTRRAKVPPPEPVRGIQDLARTVRDEALKTALLRLGATLARLQADAERAD